MTTPLYLFVAQHVARKSKMETQLTQTDVESFLLESISDFEEKTVISAAAESQEPAPVQQRTKVAKASRSATAAASTAVVAGKEKRKKRRHQNEPESINGK